MIMPQQAPSPPTIWLNALLCLLALHEGQALASLSFACLLVLLWSALHARRETVLSMQGQASAQCSCAAIPDRSGLQADSHHLH